MKCEIEANVGCCDYCLQKMRRKLERIRGVESVELYPEIKRVVVTGKIEPSTLLRAVKKVKATAQILTVQASRPSNNFDDVNDEDGGDCDHNTKKKKEEEEAASVVAPINQEPTATVDYYPEMPPGGKQGIASDSEVTSYALNLTAYGFDGGISYRKDVTYK